jgi:hypothetical protein
MNPIEKYLSVALAASLKFFGGPITGLALKLSYWEIALATITGMMVSVLVSAFLGERIQNRFLKNQKKFSKRTRLAVKTYKKFGLLGIACLTPLLFTPIGGTLIALSFKIPIPKIIAYMLGFGIFWGLIVTAVMQQFWGIIQKVF